MAWRGTPRRGSLVLGNSRAVVDTKRAPNRKTTDRRENGKARLLARGYQDPDLKRGAADASSCVSLRSSPLQVVFLKAPKRWRIWSYDVKNAFLRAGGLSRDVLHRDPAERSQSNPHRIRKLRTLALGLDSAPGASYRSLRKYLFNSGDSLAEVGLQFR